MARNLFPRRPAAFKDLPHPSTSFHDILQLACSRVEELRCVSSELERRQLTRKKIAVRAQCAGSWGVSRCLITDFGEGGLAIVCGHPHQVGDVIRLRWWFGEEHLPAEVDCVVRHITGTHIGAEFMHATAGQRARLASSLQLAIDGDTIGAA